MREQEKETRKIVPADGGPDKTVSRKMSRNPVKSKAVQEQIFNAIAKAILNGRGGTMTLDEIAAEVGRTKGTIYYHFKSKGELLYHMTRHVYDTIRKSVRPILRNKSIPPKERLERAIYTYVLIACQNSELVRAILLTDITLRGLPPKLASSLTRRRLASEIETAELVEEIAETEGGDFPSADVAMRMIFSTINGVFLWYRQNSGLSPGEMSRYVTRYIMDGLFPRGTGKATDAAKR